MVERFNSRPWHAAEQDNAHLRQRLDALLRRLYGPKAERLDPTQLLLFAQAQASPMAIAPIFQLYLKDAEAVRQAAIPVEKIRGPVLLVTGNQDQVWPAAHMADLVMQRLAAFKHPYPDQHLCYANCGHAIRIPNTPVGETRFRNRVGEVFELGGTPQGSGYAAWDSWPRVLKFLDENLKGKK